MSEQKFDWFRIVLLGLAVAGVLLSLTLVRMSAGQDAPALLAWACGQAPAVGPLAAPSNCEKALASTFSRVTIFAPRAISTATLGMAYFTILGIWLLVVGRLPGRLHRFWLLTALFGLGGLLVSAFFVYIMAAKMDSWCGLCLITHVLNVPLVIGIWVLWLSGGSPAAIDAGAGESRRHLWKIPAMALVVGLAVALAQVRDAQTADAMKALESESNALDRISYTSAKVVDIPVHEDDPVLGPADARHTVVIFSDMQCPYCSQFAPLFEQVQRELAIQRFVGKAGKTAAAQQEAVRAAATMPAEQLLAQAPFRIVFKHYPLNRTCNSAWKPMMPMADHKYACEAAAATEAARILGGDSAFWKMHNAVYAARATLSTQPYRAIAAQIGLDPDRFEQVWKDPQTMVRVQRDSAEAAKIGVSSTPSVFLDGRLVSRPVKIDMQQPVAKTAQMWSRLLQYSAAMNARSAGAQPTGPTRAEMSERARRARAAAAQEVESSKDSH